MQRHANWIAGRPTPSKAGIARLSSRRPGDGEALGEWPLSAAGDVDGALAGLEPPGLGTSEVQQLLDRAAAALAARSGDLAVGLAATEARLGIGPGELAAGPRAFGLGIGGAGQPARPGDSLTLVAAHWSHRVDALFDLVAGELLDGRGVLLVADPQLPMAAETLVQALLAAGLPPRSVAVLFDLQPAGWCELAHVPGLRRRGRLGEDEAAELEAFTREVPELTGLLEELGRPRAGTWDLAQRARDLGLDPATGTGLEQLAADLVEAAFAPTTGFFGLAHGAPLLATAPARYYAAFVDATLVAFDRLVAQLGDPVPALSRGGGGRRSGLGARYTARWRELVDQGAAILVGGNWSSSPGGPQLEPCLLANVDPGELQRPAAEPLGILGLVRLPVRLDPGPKSALSAS